LFDGQDSGGFLVGGAADMMDSGGQKTGNIRNVVIMIICSTEYIHTYLVGKPVSRRQRGSSVIAKTSNRS
jgi:hypothetical protein